MEAFESNDENDLIVWLNGKTSEHSYKLKITQQYKSVRAFVSTFIKKEGFSSEYIEKAKIFNAKGIELEDSDVFYLKGEKVIYLSLDGLPFNNANYFNQYKIIKEIKKGGYGQVFLAQNTLTKNEVAIKKTDVRYFSSDELYNISRESIYLNTLIHPNIIKTYGSFTYDNAVYTVMEYCEGGELSQLILDNKQIPEEDLKNYFTQIYNAVKFIHSQNVIHRDLKPNNLLFLDKEKTHLVLIDFGISGVSNGKNREKINAGTLRYIPPELLLTDDSGSSNKIDMWAMGIILYLLIYKKFPFEGTDEQIRDKICNQALILPKKVLIKKTLANLLRALLEKNPNNRIDITSTLFYEWFNDNSQEYEVEIKPVANTVESPKKTKTKTKAEIPGYLKPTGASKRRSAGNVEDIKNIKDIRKSLPIKGKK
ncbi:MAG: serine/threonine-protein kinase [archaeon]|nr:serine/threonine-protein kinase [archaeon]